MSADESLYREAQADLRAPAERLPELLLKWGARMAKAEAATWYTGRQLREVQAAAQERARAAEINPDSVPWLVDAAVCRDPEYVRAEGKHVSTRERMRFYQCVMEGLRMRAQLGGKER